MYTKFINDSLKYDGSQLASLFAYRIWDIQGESIVAFIGPCEVREHLVDLEDLKADAFIYSEKMLHFIIEHFERDLEKTVLRQRMFIAILCEKLAKMGKDAVRSGDDIYIQDAKLSVSIATLSPVSSLIHTGLNIISKGTPVKAIGLGDLGIENIEDFAKEVMTAYVQETLDMRMACCKVRGVS